MERVISINLNGNAYQLEEAGYEVLVRYLDDASAELKDNPARDEVLADFEQAIAEKCQAFLGPHKTVVTAAEVTRIVDELGPVDGGSGGEDDDSGEPRKARRDRARLWRSHSRRLGATGAYRSVVSSLWRPG